VAAKQSQVEADSEPGIFSCESNGFIECGLIHHQAGSGENAFTMGANDGLIDGGRAAEVIGVDDEATRKSRNFCLSRGRSAGCGTGSGNCKLKIENLRFQNGRKLLQVKENPGGTICSLSGIKEREAGGLDFAGVYDALLDVSGALGGET